MSDFNFGDDEDFDFGMEDDLNDDGEIEAPISASECIRRINAELTDHQLRLLTKDGTLKAPQFSKMVFRGDIPFVFVEGSTRKKYNWQDVAQAVGVRPLHERNDKEDSTGTKITYRNAEGDAVEETVTLEHNGEKLEVRRSIFDEYADRLTDEIAECIVPMERMNVTDKFWGSMFKEFKLKVQMGAYIELARVTEVLDMVLPNTRDSLYKIAPTIAQRHPSLPPEVIEDIHEAVSAALKEIQDVMAMNPNTKVSEFLELPEREELIQKDEENED